ncbi:MAG: acyltransferase family protein [Paracoccaceae bacterium]
MTDTDGRLHGLDFLRGIAMLLGIVYHAPVIYFIDNGWFEALDFLGIETRPQPEGSYFSWLVFSSTHLWRMPLFFILAGFFAAMIVERKGVAHFARDRAVRITATLFVFMGIFMITLKRDLGEFNHMWFLWQLTLFSAATVAWHWAGFKLLVALKAWHLVLLLPLAMLMAQVFREDQLQQPLALHIQDPVNLLVLTYYAPFYLIGMGLWHGRGSIQELAKTRWIVGWFVVGIAGSVLILGDPNNVRSDVVRAAASGMTTFGMSFGLIGLVQRIVTRRYAVVAWLVEGSYAISIFHFYPTVLAATGLELLGQPQGVVIAGAIIGGFIASVTQWYLFVRWTPLDALMNGPAKSRFMGWWRARQVAKAQ